jgi:hypothetical protein
VSVYFQIRDEVRCGNKLSLDSIQSIELAQSCLICVIIFNQNDRILSEKSLETVIVRLLRSNTHNARITAVTGTVHTFHVQSISCGPPPRYV